MNLNVLVIGSGEHHNTLGVIRSLGERHIGVSLITIGDLKKHYVSSSKYVKEFHALHDIKELASYLLYRKVLVSGKEIIISCADAVTEHLNNYMCCLSNRYIIPGVPNEGEMFQLMDKTTMIGMISMYGISSPNVWAIPSELESVKYPCITKSFISSHGKKTDINIFHSLESLSEFVKINNDALFAQDYITKKEEVQFIGCSLLNGEEVIIPGMTKILRSQSNTNTGFLEYGPIDPFYNDVIIKSKQYIKDCKYSGLFSIEFLRDENDKVYFLEINFRNDGNAYCVTKSGINLPLIWVKANLGGEYKQEIKHPQRIIAMPEFQDFKLVLQKKVALIQWLKDLKRTDCFLEYDKKDVRPFFKYILNKIL